MDVSAEIDDLKRRVGDLEGAMNVLSARFGTIQPELSAMQRESSEGCNRIGVMLDRMLLRLDTMNTQIWSLRDDLPKLVGEVVVSAQPSPAREDIG